MSLLIEKLIDEGVCESEYEVESKDVPVVLEEYYNELQELVCEIKNVLEKAPEDVRNSAFSYWYARLKMALNKNGGLDYTMEDTVHQMEEAIA